MNKRTLLQATRARSYLTLFAALLPSLVIIANAPGSNKCGVRRLSVPDSADFELAAPYMCTL